MKIQIRKNIFETNSSSVHAITVSKNKPINFYPEYASCEFNVGEFGWEHCTYYDFDGKSSYLWTAIINHFIKVVEDEETYIDYDGKTQYKHHYELDKDNPEYIKIKEAIKTALINAGIEDDDWNIRFQEDFETSEYGSLETGYIDHTPEMDFINSLVFNEDRLIRFLFNDSSYITTWNDNEWYLDEETEDKIIGEYWDPEQENYKPGYYEANDWAHFGGIPKDSEWNYIKDN